MRAVIFSVMALISSQSAWCDDLLTVSKVSLKSNEVLQSGPISATTNIVDYGNISFVIRFINENVSKEKVTEDVRINLEIEVKSVTDSFMYSNVYSAAIVISDVDINWVSGECKLSNYRLIEINSKSNKSLLRNDVDNYIENELVKKAVYAYVNSVAFTIPYEDLKGMRDRVKYVLRMDSSDELVLQLK